MPNQKYTPKYGEEIAAELIREYEVLAGERANFESHWTEIAERVVPTHRDLFQSKGLSTKGSKKTEYIFDSTAAVALDRFSAILDSLLTPSSQTWHKLMCSDSKLAKDRNVVLWFEELNRALFKYRYSPRANFTSQNQQNFKSLGAYGSGCMFIDKLAGKRESGLRYRNCHLGEIFFLENHQGIIDGVYRYYPMSARQAIQKFGADNAPSRFKEDPNKEKEFFFLHVVKPRQDVDWDRVDYKGMPFAEFYVCIEEKCLIDESGYNVFPYAPSRYEQSPGEKYGRSPAMVVLPAIKTLNEEKKTVLTQGHRTVNPVLLAFDDGVMDTISMKPGSIVSGGVSSEGRSLIHPLPVGNIAIGKELMDDERSLINDAFLITIFQILTESPQMTATEVLERSKEKGILLAPTIGRQRSEYLGPMIEREIDIIMQLGLVPPMPPALLEAKGEYRIEYDSPLSRAQRAEEASGLMRTVESTLSVVNITQNPEPLDHFNWNVIVPEMAQIQGVPLRWMNSPEIVQAQRQQRAQQAQMQQMTQAAPGAAAMIKAGAVAKKA